MVYCSDPGDGDDAGELGRLLGQVRSLPFWLAARFPSAGIVFVSSFVSIT